MLFIRVGLNQNLLLAMSARVTIAREIWGNPQIKIWG